MVPQLTTDPALIWQHHQPQSVAMVAKHFHNRVDFRIDIFDFTAVRAGNCKLVLQTQRHAQ
jgi:hypothetical protein